MPLHHLALLHAGERLPQIEEAVQRGAAFDGHAARVALGLDQDGSAPCRAAARAATTPAVPPPATTTPNLRTGSFRRLLMASALRAGWTSEGAQAQGKTSFGKISTVHRNSFLCSQVMPRPRPSKTPGGVGPRPSGLAPGQQTIGPRSAGRCHAPPARCGRRGCAFRRRVRPLHVCRTPESTGAYREGYHPNTLEQQEHGLANRSMRREVGLVSPDGRLAGW